VGPGSLASNSTDAVNGGQVNSLGTSLAAALGGGSAFNTTTGALTAPGYSVGGGSYSNVGGAISALDNRINSVESNFGAVTSNLQRQITDNRKIAAGGIAGAIASSQIRYADKPGVTTVGVGVGYFDGEAAVAAGIGFTSLDGAWRGNATINYAAGVDEVGAGAGISFAF
jgi:autotransporter adhesin